MPRLNSIQQLDNPKVKVAHYELKPISTIPSILAAYAKLIEAYDKEGFIVQKDDYDDSQVNIFRGKTVEELSKELESAQKDWDKSKADFDIASNQIHAIDVEQWTSWRKNAVRYFAEAEGWDIPELCEKEAVAAWEAAKV